MKSLLLTLLLLFSSALLLKAQPPGMPAAPDQAPIDGGLIAVAAAGAAFAVKKLKKTK